MVMMRPPNAEWYLRVRGGDLFKVAEWLKAQNTIMVYSNPNPNLNPNLNLNSYRYPKLNLTLTLTLTLNLLV